MLENPNIAGESIAACLQTNYGLESVSVRFLPIGYDSQASVYQVQTAKTGDFFVKIRSGPVNLPGLIVPGLLAEHGVPHILAPLRTRTDALWCSLEDYSVVALLICRVIMRWSWG